VICPPAVFQFFVSLEPRCFNKICDICASTQRKVTAQWARLEQKIGPRNRT
jgi:hypothetical protein